MNEKILKLNKLFDKEEAKKVIDWFLRSYGSIRTVKFLEKLKFLGFKYATKSGVSICLEDLTIPPLKRNLELETEKKFNSLQMEAEEGRATYIGKMNELDEIWLARNEMMGEEVKKNFKQSDLLNPVYMMVFSGARGNFSQVKQLVGMRGFFTNSQGRVLEFPVKSNLKEGLNISEYFTSCYGARKGIIDTALKTADAGYLTRRLVFAGQSQIIKKANCFSKMGKLILIRKDDKEKYNLAEKRLVGRVLAKDLYDQKTKKIIASQGQDICKYLVKKVIQAKRIYIRTPFNCKLNIGLCQLCYGWDVSTGHLVELGESVGILAAQSIGEPGTQLTMRTFHTGGVFVAKVLNPELPTTANSNEFEEEIYSPFDGTAIYNTKNGKKLKTKYGQEFFLTLKTKKLVVSQNKIIKVVIILPKYTMIFVKPNEKVFKRQLIARKERHKKREPNSFEKERLFVKIEKAYTPKTGLVKLELGFNLKNKKKILTKKLSKKIKNQKVWLIIGNIVNSEILARNFNIALTKRVYLNFNWDFAKKRTFNRQLHKNLTSIRISYRNFNMLSQFNKQSYKKSNKAHKKYTILTKNAKTSELFLTDNNERWILIKNNNIKLERTVGDIIFKNTKFYDNFKNCYNAQIVEVRKNKICIKNIVRFSIPLKNNKKFGNNDFLRSDFEIGSGNVYTRKKSQDDSVKGLPKIVQLLEARKTSNLTNIKDNPNEILKNEFITLSKKYKNQTAVRKAFEKIQDILISRVQEIYQEQQISIADKHLEIVVRQMTSKAMILGNGDSNFIVGEILEVTRIEKINKKLKNKIKYEPILIGISKISLSNPSFLSQASFQETTKVLARAAIEGKIDWLYGLKENLMLGNLIPIGTGYKNL